MYEKYIKVIVGKSLNSN